MQETPGSLSKKEKQAKPVGCAVWMVKLLRMFWVTGLVLLLVVLYGLYAGWSDPKQWSNAFFYAAIAHIFCAAISMMGSTHEISAASELRYVPDSGISETRQQLADLATRKEPFAVRMFLGGILTFLISFLVR